MVYIWSFNPIDIDAKMFDLIGEKYNIFFCNYYENEMAEERINCGYLKEYSHFIRKHIKLCDAKKMVDNGFDSISIFFGMLTPMNKELLKVLKLNKKDSSIIIISERYNAFGNVLVRKIKSIVRFINFKVLAIKYRNIIKAFFAYGNAGVAYFKRCGFNNVYPTIYATNTASFPVNNENGNICKFVYIGRFDYNLKGVDVLIDSLERVINEKRGGGNWHIDFIGDYGANKEEIRRWVKANEQFASVKTKVPFDNVIETLSQYDVCIAPSRKEGYHTLPSQCIAAGIACIVTDECVSNEIVNKYSTGLVVKSDSVTELEKAIKTCVDNPELMNNMKLNTERAKDDICIDSIADYFWQQTQYSLGKIEEVPICPWI